MIRITQHRKKCIGCNACVEIHKQRWRISKKDGKSVLVGGKGKKDIYHVITETDEYELNKLAAANCPVNIIKVEHLIR